MPKAKKNSKKHATDHCTVEATSYLSGVFNEFHGQIHKYQELTRNLLSMEARVELAEKTLCLHRDHLASSILATDSALPNDWNKYLRMVKFVGVRLADASMALLREKKKMTPQQIFEGLNNGMFRFRTNSPLREIHAALLKQPFARKVGEAYVWTGTADQEILPLRPRAHRASVILDLKPLKVSDETPNQKEEPQKSVN